MRLDNELVIRKMFATRNKSQTAIKSGIVFCDNKCVKKSSFEVTPLTLIEIRGETLKYVSRAGLKLEKAVREFNINFHNKTMIDIGSSTGGFTDCALQMGVQKVIAIDVGNDIMDQDLRTNKKVELYENTDFRNMDDSVIKNANIATIDISFISVTKIMQKLSTIESLDEIVCLIKPQFECGKEIADKYKGLVLDKSVHKSVILNVINAFKEIGFSVQGLASSPIKGGSGNIEYVSYFVKNSPSRMLNVGQVVDNAFKI